VASIRFGKADIRGAPEIRYFGLVAAISAFRTIGWSGNSCLSLLSAWTHAVRTLLPFRRTTS